MDFTIDIPGEAQLDMVSENVVTKKVDPSQTCELDPDLKPRWQKKNFFYKI